MKIYTYDAFTKNMFEGNSAGVVLVDQYLKEDNMQEIAKELNYSETVFIFESEVVDIKVRFFTPLSEIDMCGHATIAYCTCLIENNILKSNNGLNKIEVETNLGIFEIEVTKENDEIIDVFMKQDDGKIDYIKNLDIKVLADSLGIEESSIDKNIDIVKAYSGIWDLMVPIKSKEELYSINPDMKKVENISKDQGIISIHPFCIDDRDRLKVYVRNFAPIVGINEESATGTSNGALAYYLKSIGKIKENEVMVSHQGINMGRESFIFSKIVDDKIYVGGTAVKIIEGEINL